MTLFVPRLVMVLGMMVLASPAPAQTLSDPAPTPPPVPATLSQKDVTGLLTGQEMGMAKAAELNGFAGVKEVLSLTADLDLTDDQAKAILSVRDKLNKDAKRLGADIIARETDLNKAFADKSITVDMMNRLTLESGLLWGRLRAAHLHARLEIDSILTPAQVEKMRDLKAKAQQ